MIRNKGTEGIKSITEVIQRHEVHVESRLIASVPLIAKPENGEMVTPVFDPCFFCCFGSIIAP